MRIQFLGGVDTVTGSKHLIETGRARVLRDCGLYQGRRKEAAERNRTLPFEIEGLDAVVLSHAHIDHCGNLPTLARKGYRGPIHATTATVELCGVMLRDAARIQEQDAAYLNQKSNRGNAPPVEPLYTADDAEAALKLFRGCRYNEPVDVAEGARATFIDAGHVLGAALNVIEAEEDGRVRRVGFAFDLGRKDLPLLRDPEAMPPVDALVIESTYGDRVHEDAERAEDELQAALSLALGRGGKVLIPTFALERAQEVLFHLTRLMLDGRLPHVPVYVDSPMASAVTRIFDLYDDYLDEETLALNNRIGSALQPSWVHFVSSVEESKRVTACEDPCIVLAGSGMCEHGRILHHLKHGIENPAHMILMVGYQAQYTLGRRLVEGAAEVRIFGDTFTRKAEVRALQAFSGHADRNDLIEYTRATGAKRVYLVHGEPDQRASLAEALRAEGVDAHEPHEGDVAEL